MRKFLTFLIALAAIVFAVCSPASAYGCKSFGQQGGTGCNSTIAVSAPPVLSFLQAMQNSSTAGATATYTNMNIGSTAGFTTRRVIMSLLQSGGTFNGGLTSVVINGSITATIHAVANTSGGGAAIVSADIPTGTTCNVVVTTGGTIFQNTLIAAYTVDDALLVSTTPSTATGNVSSGTSITSGSFTETAGGFIVAVGSSSGNWGGSGTSISGFTLDANGGALNKEYWSHLSSVGSTGSITETLNWTTANGADLAVAAWR